ncbi:hypothetical protein JW911_03335 [Candidatus Peregrinibacteria bacterium]|nr:hypothetical protein [Candidatus Peregrinibacteria bacterium]
MKKRQFRCERGKSSFNHNVAPLAGAKQAPLGQGDEKMERMKLFLGALCAIVVIGLGGNARAQGNSNRRSIIGKCMVWDGTHGRITGTAPVDGKVHFTVTSRHRVTDLWLSAECGRPDIPSVSGMTVTMEKEGDKLSDHYNGWRILLRRVGAVAGDRVEADITLPTINATFRVNMVLGRTVEDVDEDAARAREKAEEAARRAGNAEKSADEARKAAKSSGYKTWGKLSLGIGGLWAPETAGKPGGGVLISLTGDLWRPGRFFRLGLGIQANLVAYQLEFRGPESQIVNEDESALQIDAAAYIEPRVDLWNWASLYLQTGFGGRVLIMPDSIPFQTDEGWVRQIEGGTDAGGIWFVRLGGTFWFHPSSPIGLDFSYLLSVSLNRMVQNPGGIPYEHKETNVWTHALVFGLKARF